MALKKREGERRSKKAYFILKRLIEDCQQGVIVFILALDKL
jgi:hypothetical protein